MKNKSIVDQCNQEPILEIGGWVIRPFNVQSLWIESPSGEGMEVPRKTFIGWLAAMFESYF